MSTSVIELLAQDLNHQGGVFCPSPLAKMETWNTHPKVYLDVAHTGEASDISMICDGLTLALLMYSTSPTGLLGYPWLPGSIISLRERVNCIACYTRRYEARKTTLDGSRDDWA